MGKVNNVVKILFWLIVFAGLVGIGVGGYYLNNKIDNLKKTVLSLDYSKKDIEIAASDQIADVEVLTCSSACKSEIEKIVSDAVLAGSRGEVERIVETKTIVTESSGTDYIAMGSTSTTISTDWVTLEETGVYIDLIEDYGEDAIVSWEVFLKVQHSNGQAFARLYDATNNIAVDLSELSTTNNAEFERVSSGYLPFWRGRNLYEIQVKSLNSFLVTYSGGRIKISY
jgi:hypothetical protein